MEVMVLFHGTMVALMAVNNGPWAQFFFGFFGIFIVTQMHGFGFSRWVKWGFGAIYLGAVAIVYGSRDWQTMDELIRIPLVELLLVVVLAAIIWVGLWITGSLPTSKDKKASA